MEGHLTRDFLRLLATGAVGLTAASCAQKVLGPDVNVPPEQSGISAPNPEAAKVTSATMVEVVDANKKAEYLASLPTDKPSVEGGDENISVSEIKVGDHSFAFAIYTLSKEAKDQKIGELNPNTIRTPEVASYMQFENSDGSKTFVRLIGKDFIVFDQNGNATGEVVHSWSYDPSGYATQDGVPLDSSEEVISYVNPGESKILFRPSVVMSPNVIIPGYVTNTDLNVFTSSGELNVGLKINPIVSETIIVTEGSEAALAGIPVGAKLVGNEFIFTNPIKQEVKVGEMVDGTITPEKWLKYNLAPTREEVLANPADYEWDVDAVLAGDPGKKHKLEAKFFPEGVITGQDVVLTLNKVGYWKNLEWGKDAKVIYEANPEASPYRVVGYFSTKGSKAGKEVQFFGKVVQCLNLDGSILYLTVIYDEYLLKTMPSDAMWPMAYYTYPGECKVSPSCNIVANSEMNKLIKEWADTDSIPPALEKIALIANS